MTSGNPDLLDQYRRRLIEPAEKEKGESHRLAKRVRELLTFRQIAVIGAILVALWTASGTSIILHEGDARPVVHSWSWWGLSHRYTPLSWKDGQWKAKDEQGKWYVAIQEPDLTGEETDPRR